MSREIKFRAWDKRDNKIIYNHTADYGIITNMGVMILNPHNKDNEYSFMDKNRFELMQSTRLKDKNGKEIYEGDLLKHNNNIFFVKYSGNQKVLLLRDVSADNMNWRSLEWCSNVSKYIEVIGNIHENKDLL